MMIEDVLSSKGRVKILRILAEIGELNISDIARRAGLNYSTTSQHLFALEKFGLVRCKKFGRIRIYVFVDESPLAKAFKQLMDVWEQTYRGKP